MIKKFKQYISEILGTSRPRNTDPKQVLLTVILKGSSGRTLDSLTSGLKDVIKKAMIQSIKNILNGEDPIIRVPKTTIKNVTKKRKAELKKELENL